LLRSKLTFQTEDDFQSNLD